MGDFCNYMLAPTLAALDVPLAQQINLVNACNYAFEEALYDYGGGGCGYPVPFYGPYPPFPGPFPGPGPFFGGAQSGPGPMGPIGGGHGPMGAPQMGGVGFGGARPKMGGQKFGGPKMGAPRPMAPKMGGAKPVDMGSKEFRSSHFLA